MVGNKVGFRVCDSLSKHAHPGVRWVLEGLLGILDTPDSRVAIDNKFTCHSISVSRGIAVSVIHGYTVGVNI